MPEFVLKQIRDWMFFGNEISEEQVNLAWGDKFCMDDIQDYAEHHKDSLKEVETVRNFETEKLI